MDIRIGIINSPRELGFESSQSAADVEKIVGDAISSGTPHFTLTDDKGKRYIVATGSVAYVEIGSEETRRIGFVG
ncbi:MULTISPECIES: DUF3107 domain-containing protein [Mycetocola]|uniref:DUF3107 domain-containing protein n=1 Tax=Mycetocola lacteus TaxID=76637 RepID=A0A3L7AK10_9MICO|nr:MULTISPECIES: DUF3107 domain-containing protein [Mycetocola]MCS4275554.1 hypothetical protein [Mycetocola sp. BIGb0189]RLP80749.1 DUF3107 domain-containing protein [Mycetocola lacteus]RLP84534.1 DUF3107 domain-containing protein [Mycetocola lacteus]